MHKYLLICLFVPFLSGVVAGCVCTVHMEWDINAERIFVTMAVLLCGMVLCHHFAPERRWLDVFFVVFAFAFLFLFGYFRSAGSHREMYNAYGKGYKYEIYRRNKMQNETALRWQKKMHQHIQTSCKGKNKEKAIIEAMTIGYKKGLTKSLRNEFAAAGISHMLALSGFHLSIVYLFLFFLLAPIRTSPAGRWLSFAVTLLVIWSYAATSGMSPSMVRATIFCTIVELCFLLQREVRMINSCALAAIIILMIDPLMIGHVGFQLSFCSITAIALIQKRIPRNPFYAVIVITITCSIVTFPLVTHYFGSMPVYGLLGNMAGTLFAYPIVFSSLLWWVFSLIGLPVAWLLNIITMMVSALIYVANTISCLPYSTIAYRPSLPEVLLWYGIIVCLYLLADMYLSTQSERWLNQ